MNSLEVAALSDVGGRSTNEDKVLILRINDVQFLAVADGMGGHAAGEVASNIALIEIEKYIKANIGIEDVHDVVNKAIKKANREVYVLSKQKDEYTDMGTTLVVSLIRQDKALIANVGDSRAYLLNQEGIAQITTDHSLVERLVATGQITREIMTKPSSLAYLKSRLASREIPSQ